ncbi:MAG TPA: hypothetical protein VK400_07975 [Pyrinomonadaceae bacterium]|nr:hypothetical protein [Pyrinomonadaceae bacterium]
MKKLFSSIVFIAALALAAFADVRLPDTPTPKPSKKIDTRLRISISKDAKEARLRIPKSQLRQLRAELDELDGGGREDAAASLNFGKAQTIVSGLFLTLAFAAGGVWLMRSRDGKSETKTGGKTLVIAAGAGLFLSGAAATIGFANVGPPPETRNITGKLFSNSVHAYKQASGRIQLETTDEAEEIELIVPDVAKSPNVTGGEE